MYKNYPSLNFVYITTVFIGLYLLRTEPHTLKIEDLSGDRWWQPTLIPVHVLEMTRVTVTKTQHI